MLRWLFQLVLILVLAAILAAFIGLRSYRAFTREDLVMIVECEPAPPGADYRFLLKLRQVAHDVPGPEERFPMQGEQWTIEGEILTWAPWLTAAGVRPIHKLTRLSSRYRAAEQELAGSRSAYDLNGGSSWLWRGLHQFGPSFPWVDAAYGNAVYTDARPGARWDVTVAHNGYVIRPRRAADERPGPSARSTRPRWVLVSAIIKLFG